MTWRDKVARIASGLWIALVTLPGNGWMDAQPDAKSSKVPKASELLGMTPSMAVLVRLSLGALTRPRSPAGSSRRLAFLGVVLQRVQAALGLGKAAPAAGALVFAEHHRPRTGPAADARVALIV